MDEFNELLLKIVDETIRQVVGDYNTLIIYNYLERNSCPIRQIPTKLDLFSLLLRNLLGVGRGQILGASALLENAIVKALSLRLGLKPEEESTNFADRIRRLRESYDRERSAPRGRKP
jgi:hypothetical protein